MSKNLYRVRDKSNNKVNVNADFYETNTSTGISIFYTEGGPHSVELVATFTLPISIFLASSNKKKDDK